jgi:GABA permease
MTEPRSTPEEASRRILVVANQTACGDELLEVITTRMAAGPCLFTLLVPATPAAEHATWTEGEARSLARTRMEVALARFAAAGAVTGEGVVGDANPVRAIDDVLLDGSFDEIILSTLPPGVSRWLRLDLPRRVEQRFGLPVTTVISARQLTG